MSDAWLCAHTSLNSSKWRSLCKARDMQGFLGFCLCYTVCARIDLELHCGAFPIVFQIYILLVLSSCYSLLLNTIIGEIKNEDLKELYESAHQNHSANRNKADPQLHKLPSQPEKERDLQTNTGSRVRTVWGTLARRWRLWKKTKSWRKNQPLPGAQQGGYGNDCPQKLWKGFSGLLQ